MRARTIAALGVAAYAVFLVATTPASVIASRMGRGVELTQARGTLWHGSARARVNVPAGPIVLDTLEWRLMPLRLAAGRLAFDVKAAARGLDARLQVGRGFTGWELRDVAARVEPAFLAALAPWLPNWRPEGTVSLAAPALTWNGGEARGEASAEWRNAALSLSEVRPLGSYRLEARGDGGPAQLKVTTLEGPLKITGQGTLTSPARLAFSGEARAEGDAAKGLEPLLDLLGARRPDGARALEWHLN